jgi:branched-chain amino acid transport system ATP-binding protein
MMLELKNINAGYNSFQALFDVSLSVKAGEAVAVIGPNGAGKSTLLRVISRLIEASSGSMEMQGNLTETCHRMKWLDLGLRKCQRGDACFLA